MAEQAPRKTAVERSREYVLRNEDGRLNDAAFDHGREINRAIAPAGTESAGMKSPLELDDLATTWELQRRGIVVLLEDTDVLLFVVAMADGEPVQFADYRPGREGSTLEARAIGDCRRCGRPVLLEPVLTDRGDLYRALRMREPWAHNCEG